MIKDEVLQPIISAPRQLSLPLPEPYSANVKLSMFNVPMEMRTILSTWSEEKRECIPTVFTS